MESVGIGKWVLVRMYRTREDCTPCDFCNCPVVIESYLWGWGEDNTLRHDDTRFIPLSLHQAYALMKFLKTAADTDGDLTENLGPLFGGKRMGAYEFHRIAKVKGELVTLTSEMPPSFKVIWKLQFPRRLSRKVLTSIYRLLKRLRPNDYVVKLQNCLPFKWVRR